MIHSENRRFLDPIKRVIDLALVKNRSFKIARIVILSAQVYNRIKAKFDLVGESIGTNDDDKLSAVLEN